MKYTIKKCKHCNNNIKVDVVNSLIENDFGGIIIKCAECNVNSFVKITNPSDVYVRDGGSKVECWDNDITTDKEVLDKYDNIKQLEKGVLVVGEINTRNLTYNLKSTSIHHCFICGESIENLIYKNLSNNEGKITDLHQSIMGNYYKGYVGGEYVVVKLAITCTCGHKGEAFLYTNFNDGKFFTQNGIEELLLIGTNNSIKSSALDGIFSKTECIDMLEKFIFRWDFIFPKVLIVNPFVGHQWMTEDQVLELWDWLLNMLDPHKTIFITRRATFNKYKKIFENKNGVSLEFLESYDLDNKIISDLTSKQDFHAKVFAGISSEKTEMLAGSFNLLKGKSFENLGYNTYSGEVFQNNFISKLNIPIKSEPLEEMNCILISQESNNDFTFKQIQKSEINKILLSI